MDEDLRIPRRLDDPPRIFLWEMDVFMVWSGGVFIGIMAGYMLTGIGIGVGFGWAYSKLKSGKHPGFLVHLAYWHLPSGFSLRRAPPSAERRFYG